MAISDGNKSEYVGNHGGAYTDIDGMRKQFTYVDHDKKTKISLGGKKTSFQEEWEYLEKAVLGHPIFDKYLKDNDLEWGFGVNLGHLRAIKELIDGEVQRSSIQGQSGGENTGDSSINLP